MIAIIARHDSSATVDNIDGKSICITLANVCRIVYVQLSRGFFRSV